MTCEYLSGMSKSGGEHRIRLIASFAVTASPIRFSNKILNQNMKNMVKIQVSIRL